MVKISESGGVDLYLKHLHLSLIFSILKILLINLQIKRINFASKFPVDGQLRGSYTDILATMLLQENCQYQYHPELNIRY